MFKRFFYPRLNRATGMSTLIIFLLTATLLVVGTLSTWVASASPIAHAATRTIAPTDHNIYYVGRWAVPVLGLTWKNL